MALLWPSHRVLFVGDAAANMMGLGLSLGYEDLELGKRSLARLATLDFEVACFGHGAPIKRGASARFQGCGAGRRTPDRSRKVSLVTPTLRLTPAHPDLVLALSRLFAFRRLALRFRIEEFVSR